jgi:hypothetical protein
LVGIFQLGVSLGDVLPGQERFGPAEPVGERRPRDVEVGGQFAHVDRPWRLVVAVFDGGRERGRLFVRQFASVGCPYRG